MDMDRVKALMRDVPDFPKPGIVFKDITPILKDPEALGLIIEEFRNRFAGQDIEPGTPEPESNESEVIEASEDEELSSTESTDDEIVPMEE